MYDMDKRRKYHFVVDDSSTVHGPLRKVMDAWQRYIGITTGSACAVLAHGHVTGRQDEMREMLDGFISFSRMCFDVVVRSVVDPVAYNGDVLNEKVKRMETYLDGYNDSVGDTELLKQFIKHLAAITLNAIAPLERHYKELCELMVEKAREDELPEAEIDAKLMKFIEGLETSWNTFELEFKEVLDSSATAYPFQYTKDRAESEQRRFKYLMEEGLTPEESFRAVSKEFTSKMNDH